MMDLILILLKDTVEDAVKKNVYIPLSKKDLVVEVSMKAVCDSFRKYLIPDNISNLMSLFSGYCDLRGSYIVSSIKAELAKELQKRMGLSDNIENISKSIVHQVICAFWGEMNVPRGVGFNVDTLVYIFSGKRETEKATTFREEAMTGDLSLLMEI